MALAVCVRLVVYMNLNDYTVKQLIIACGIARGLTRTEICRISSCVPSYITKIEETEKIKDLIKSFQLLPADKDTKIYQGIGTILLEIGRLIYSIGELNLK